MTGDAPPPQPLSGKPLEQYVRDRTAELSRRNAELQQQIDDLTLRKGALRERHEQYRIMFEQAAVGFAYVGLDGRFLNVNDHLCKLFQYSREELLSRNWVDLTHPSDLPGNSEHVSRMIAGEHSFYVTQKRYFRKDGTYFWASLSSVLARGSDSQPKYFVSVIVDISERKHAEEMLRKSEQRLQSILDHTTAVIYVKDLDGRYELANRRYEELFHIPVSEIKGRTDFEIFPSDLAQKLRANDQMVLKSGLAQSLEEIVLQDDGLHTYISIKVPLLDASGCAVAICGISTDITRRKQEEAQMALARETAERASRAKSNFLANISHEIRTPIMAILGSAELVGGGGITQEQTGEHAEVILRSGRHLLALVDDLLDQSRIDTGRLDISCGECCLPEIMADVEAVTAPLLRNGVELQIIYENNVPEQIITDRTRTTQAVINLVQNAMKFTSHGHVYVRVSIEQVQETSFLNISVEDTGEGIAKTDLNRIFEPFTQLNVGGNNQTPTTGMGLGLPLARSIAERLGGSLDVQSEPGVGSVFTLRIPVGPLSPANHWMTPAEAMRWRHTQRIDHSGPQSALRGSALLAEDSPEVLGLLKFALERTGVKVVPVTDGSAAIEKAKAGSFDLVLLDIRMPHCSGLEAAQAIRSQGYSGPMIALTASTAQTERDRILAAGFDELWPKPISLERFIELASAYLDSTPEKRDAGSLDRRLQKVRIEFALGLPKRMERLMTIWESDQTATGEILHQLVGSSGTVGLMEFSDLARLVYGQFKAGPLPANHPDLICLYQMAHQIAREA